MGALVTPFVFWSGAVFHRATWANVRHRTTTMDTLVTISTLRTWSRVELLPAPRVIALRDRSVIITLSCSESDRDGGEAAFGSLVRAWPILARPTVGQRAAGQVDALQVGDRFIVPGEKIPTDGIVIDGRAAVGASMVSVSRCRSR